MTREAVHFEGKDEALRRDVRQLGALLGEVLAEQHSAALLARVEAARRAARARRQGDAGAAEVLAEQLRGLTPELTLELVRAFAAYFGLVNLAERVHRIRRRSEYLKDPATPQPGGFEAALRALRAAGVDADGALEVLRETLVEPVFTAHPTEAVRRTLLTKEQRIARALVDRSGAAPGSDPDRTSLARIRVEVTAAWQTQEHLTVRPSVADEVEHVTFYLGDVIYRVVPRLYADLAAALDRVYGPCAGRRLPCPLVRFASWVGGDMDGNPNVGAATLRAAMARHAERVLGRYRDEVRGLHATLSQSLSRVGVSEAVLERNRSYRAAMPETQASIPERYLEMPYRVLLWFVAARLEATLRQEARAYPGPEELLRDLEVIHASLLENRGAEAGAFQVQRLLWRVRTFGFHLATLDVRQDSAVHRRVVATLLDAPGFPELPAKARAAQLEAALATPLAPAAAGAGEVAETLELLGAMRDGLRRYGEAALGPFILSMAQGADDALAVLYLATRAGLTGPGGDVPLDVCPLFETVDDLAGARATMENLLASPRYRRHLHGRGGRQMIMLGYSDSNKDAGLVASRVALERTQVELVEWAAAHDVRLVLFHGRGGSISRGGTKPRAAVLSAPPGAVQGRLRLTEQGEIIHAKYGLRGLAVRTLELLVAATVERRAGLEQGPGPPAEWSRAMDLLAERSRRHYRALVADHPRFLEYFRAATPIDVIERLRYGSRPASRRQQRGVRDLRAIPWVFAWTQSRLVLPGWYGLGTGLEALVAESGLPMVRELATRSAFLDTLLADAEMVAAKADLGIAARYAPLAGAAGEELFPVVEEEFQRTVRWLLEIRGTRELLEHEPVLQRAIRLRNPYVDPMSLLQVDLLARWRAGDRQDPGLEEALITTVQGIARGLQNTG